MKEEKLNTLMKVAEAVSENSHDQETKVGCVVVGSEGECILSSYNGFIAGVNDSKLPKTRPEKYPYMIHSEMNAVCQAAKRGISIKDCSLVCTLSPCIHCCRMLWQCGIRVIYFKDFYKDFNRQKNMKDLKLEVSSFGKFFKLELKEKY